MDNLWSSNHPRNFWHCQPDPAEKTWQQAIEESLPLLGLSVIQPDMASILALTLGEGRFGPDHWQLSFSKRLYYLLKPALPRAFTRLLRRVYRNSHGDGAAMNWPIERRYVAFTWNILARVLRESPGEELIFKSLWPEGRQFCLVLTHDVERKAGVEFVLRVADLEEKLGFRSSFNFVPKDYELDAALVNELRKRGFEVGIHGLKHDGRLFDSRPGFDRAATQINDYLRSLNAVGFRSPLTLRNPDWMQALDIEYDASFFDTDPFEPMPGGTMSIWPFFLGRFVELPYTLVQDYTLTDILREDTPRVWLEKVEFVRAHCGMALLNSHPDYLLDPSRLKVYSDFLQAMQGMEDCWKALPRDVASWWKDRANSNQLSKASLRDGHIRISPHDGAGAQSHWEQTVILDKAVPGVVRP